MKKASRGPQRKRAAGAKTHGGFQSPAAAYVHGEAFVLEAIPAGDLPRVPSARAQPAALRSLRERGYSQDEIFALVVPKRTFARRQKRHEPLTIEETDKAIRLARIADLATDVFADRAKSERWLRKPKRQLDGETPLAYLASEAGARRIEDMLWRIDSGILS
jgi:putative toxin-antitoxin system antitoxin component (TIGR02293 family)